MWLDFFARALASIVLAIPMGIALYFAVASARDFISPQRWLGKNRPGDIASFRIAMALVFLVSLAVLWILARWIIIPLWEVPFIR